MSLECREPVSYASASYSGKCYFSLCYGSLRETLTAEFLERNHRVIVLLIFIHKDLLAVTLTDDQTSVSPSELVHTPEGVDRQEKAVDWVSARRMRRPKASHRLRWYIRNEVDNHPTYEHEFSLDNKNNSLWNEVEIQCDIVRILTHLETICCCDHDDRNKRECCVPRGNDDD